MIVYLSGKMTGLEDLGRVAFDRAENRLTGLGVTVISPAWLKEGLPGEAYMPICLAMIDQAEALALLPGWEDSQGAKLERAYALYQGKAVYSLDALISIAEEMGRR